jgi:putative transposase
VQPRVSPVERIRAQIDQLFASEQDLGRVLEDMAGLSVRLVIQAALAAEVTEFLGQDRSQRGERVRVAQRPVRCPVGTVPDRRGADDLVIYGR